MKQRYSILNILLFFTITLNAQEIIPLYEGVAPGSENCDYEEIQMSNPGEGLAYRNVTHPTVEVFRPKASVATETAVIICPGGGNFMLSYENEGTEVARWLSKKGITAFVLKYRLEKTPEDENEFKKFVMNFFMNLKLPTNESGGDSNSESSVPPPNEKYFGGEDGIKAMEYVREHANEFGINPEKVGLMGFSAGAAVTMYVVLNSKPNKQPNFVAPIYGGWLAGAKVPTNAPPLFIAGAADDPISSGNPDLYNAWRKAGLEAQLHMYSKGGHGFGMKKQGLPIDTWIERYYEWLKSINF